MVPPGWFRLATSPTRDWIARDHEEGDELAPFQLIELRARARGRGQSEHALFGNRNNRPPVVDNAGNFFWLSAGAAG